MAIMTDAEYLIRERRLADRNPIVRPVLAVIEASTKQVKAEMNEDVSVQHVMSHLEHQNILTAWQNGLDLFTNHDGGPALYKSFLEYLRTLAAAGYTGDTFDDLYSDHGIVATEVRS